jgi:hypothetical protein
MKSRLLATVLALAPLAAAAQSIPGATAQAYFAEAAALCAADRAQLWGVSLCGPIMFVDPVSRSIVANQADQGQLLRFDNGVYVGTFPAQENIANTAVEWSGVRWTQLLWPLPTDSSVRTTLLLHELFHRIQPQLQLPPPQEAANAHLDTLDGRYWMRLEWRALARALESVSNAERRVAARDALLFRAARRQAFPAAAAQETALELNEGLAEFTGVRLGNTTPAARTQAALRRLTVHVDDPSFVRSFAYATGPAYGLLLDRYAPRWTRRLEAGDEFGSALQAALGVAVHADPRSAEQRAAQYDGDALRAAEVARAAKRQQIIDEYRARLIDGPVLAIALVEKKLQFSPRNLLPLADVGTVYPYLRVSDVWGVLEAERGALLKSDWSAVIVSAPANEAGPVINGDGWTLTLNPKWKLAPGARNGDRVLVAEP